MTRTVLPQRTDRPKPPATGRGRSPLDGGGGDDDMGTETTAPIKNDSALSEQDTSTAEPDDLCTPRTPSFKKGDPPAYFAQRSRHGRAVRASPSWSVHSDRYLLRLEAHHPRPQEAARQADHLLSSTHGPSGARRGRPFFHRVSTEVAVQLLELSHNWAKEPGFHSDLAASAKASPAQRDGSTTPSSPFCFCCKGL